MPKKTENEKLTAAAKKLNPKRRLFCEYYASDREFFGNGVESYLEAYDLPRSKYKSAATLAYQLLINVDVLAYIDELLDIYVSDQVVDKELGWTILQKAHLPAKIAAVKEYNQMKGRHAATKIKFEDALEEFDEGELIEELTKRGKLGGDIKKSPVTQTKEST